MAKPVLLLMSKSRNRKTDVTLAYVEFKKLECPAAFSGSSATKQANTNIITPNMVFRRPSLTFHPSVTVRLSIGLKLISALVMGNISHDHERHSNVAVFRSLTETVESKDRLLNI